MTQLGRVEVTQAADQPPPGGTRSPVRVLIVASDCNPEWPSLPSVGYNAIRAIAEQTEAVVATHLRNREALAKAGLGTAEIAYMDNEYVARPMYRLGTLLRGGTQVAWTTAMAAAYLPYLAFEREVWRTFRDDIRSGRFDIVHRVTPMSPTLPSYLAGRLPVPFVIGPLNGGLRWPRGFTGELAREREWLTYVRRLYRMLPYSRSTFRRASAVLAAYGHTMEDLPRECRSRTFNFPEVGVDPKVFQPESGRSNSNVEVLFVGRLVPYKCPDVVVLAFARSEVLRGHRLTVVGDGPERARLEALVDQHELRGCVRFLGAQTQRQVSAIMGQSDVFAFPSIRELGAGVVVEAMASELACVVVDYGGPGALVGSNRGLRVPLGTKEEIVEGFVRSLERLVGDETLRRELGRRAREHAVSAYAWGAKARDITSIYEWLLGRSGERPRMPLEVADGGVGAAKHADRAEGRGA
jgi:glycosyltransferase involved in cell wall biosynthesis